MEERTQAGPAFGRLTERTRRHRRAAAMAQRVTVRTR